MQIPIYQVDAFTQARFHGNPAAICPLDHWLPVQVMQGKPKEVFTQIYNNAFPAGTISVEESAKQMNAAYGK